MPSTSNPPNPKHNPKKGSPKTSSPAGHVCHQPEARKTQHTTRTKVALKNDHPPDMLMCATMTQPEECQPFKKFNTLTRRPKHNPRTPTRKTKTQTRKAVARKIITRCTCVPSAPNPEKLAITNNHPRGVCAIDTKPGNKC